MKVERERREKRRSYSLASRGCRLSGTSQTAGQSSLQ